MATDALITLDQVVTRFMLKYKLPLEDAIIYFEHTANCVRDYYLYDAPDTQILKVTINTLSTNTGYITMPDSMMSFNGLAKGIDGQWWQFTEKSDMVNTTTTTGLVEGVDTDFGEGEAIEDPKTDTYGGVGGVNDYYYMLDWAARRIYVEGISSGTVALQYVSSGIETSGDTYIPDNITPMVDDYLLWKMAIIRGDLKSEPLRERNFTKSELKVRSLVNAMTYSQWSDLLASLCTQAPQR